MDRSSDLCLLLSLYILRVRTLCVIVYFCGSENSSTERSIQYLMGPPGLHSSFLLIFSCFLFCTLRGGDVSIGPSWPKPSWAIEKQIEDEGKTKRKRKEREREGKTQDDARDQADCRGPGLTPDLDRGPGRLPRRSEVVWKCHGGDSLHCWVMMILCSLPSLSDMISVALPPAAPEGLTSVSNRATLKAPYRQSRWAGGTGTQAEKTGEAARQRGCFISFPVALAGLQI